ncbi:MAG: RodZ domain-containing protein [Thiobacillus sp.]
MNATTSVGAQLREARETQGLSVDEVATRLRLMQRQIVAMESDDFNSLGQPVFARGFVRNYARLLDVAPEPLLEQMTGAPEIKIEAVAAPVPPSSNWFASPWLLGLLFGLLLLLAVPVGLYWWLNSAPEDEPVAVTSKQDSFVKPVPAKQMTLVPAPALPAPAEVLPETVDATPVATPATTVEPPLVNEAPAPSAVRGVVKLAFGDDSWVEVKDATGRMVHRQLNKAGSQVEIQGQPPFELVVGNAAQAQMSYNGRVIDLKPFIDVTVARFTLEE